MWQSNQYTFTFCTKETERPAEISFQPYHCSCSFQKAKSDFAKDFGRASTLSRIKENADVSGFELREKMATLETREYTPCTWDRTVSSD